jgi:phospholipid transport system substrate-binding protein
VKTFLVLLCVGFVAAGSAFADDAPKAVVEKLTNDVLGVLADRSAPTDERRHRIEQLVYEDVDFETLCRLVLGRHWSEFTPAQQADFVTEFKKHLSLTYGRNLDSYRNERVAFVGDREEARGDWVVRTKIVRGGPDDVQVDYRLRKTNGRWKIIDFIIEQVSLVANYRSQFQAILSGRSPEDLIRMIREKSARGETLKAPGVH